ncbi:MAG TPA: ankyrin repeat domain-containing protein [Bryobacteraceae bacterium]|nr:ankyrin repeat domain-containing protein [Bryobacteraceae bacterium]
MNTTDLTPLPPRPNLEQYKKQAKDFIKLAKAGDPQTLRRAQSSHPRAARMLPSGVLSPEFALADAQLVIAREHGFENWPRFAHHLEELGRKTSSISHFESAADAIGSGAAAELGVLLRRNPSLVRARSTRVHRATLLHYVSANGFENYRQKTPANAVVIAKMLLDAGAEVDALADAYGRDTTLGLVATSVHPKRAGVQLALMDLLLERGANIEGVPGDASILLAALRNGRLEAAQLLAARGARLDLEGAAGVGKLDVVRSFFPGNAGLGGGATQAQVRDGFTWACQFGHTDVAAFLLDNGVAVDSRLRHHGQTGLHWAAANGHFDLVRLLLERGAPVNAKDETWGGMPLGWLLHGWTNRQDGNPEGRYYEAAAFLVASGAVVKPEWLAGAGVRADPRMLAALGQPGHPGGIPV